MHRADGDEPAAGGVHALDVPSLRALPSLLTLAHTETVAAIGVRDRELLVLLDAARIVPDAVWTALERVGVPA